MTCREKLKIEHPTYVNDSYVAGCYGCPHNYGYAPMPEFSCPLQPHIDNTVDACCSECWDRKVMEDFKKYHYSKSNEPLILEPEDWTEEEWATICKLFGMKGAERIKVSNYTLETYGIPYTGDENR